MVQKEKQVKSYTRKSKSGKQVQVKSYSAKYNSAEDMVKEALKQKKGAGKELLETKKKQKIENIPDYDFSMDDFAHWYEGDGSKQDKAVEKSLRKILGKKNYDALNDYVADNYKKGGHKAAFKKVSSFKEGVTTKDSKPKSVAAKTSTKKSSKEKGSKSKSPKVKSWDMKSVLGLTKQAYRKLSSEDKTALNDFITAQYKGKKFDLGRDNAYYRVAGIRILNEGTSAPEKQKKIGVILEPWAWTVGDPGGYRYVSFDYLKKLKEWKR